jgi:hypothetical protein
MKNSNYIRIIVTTCSLAFVGTLPAIANLGNAWTDFQSYATDLRDYLNNNLSENFRPLEIQTQTAINNSSGDLSIPNPNVAGNNAKEQVTLYSLSDNFENNSAVRGSMLKNEIDRQITRASIEGNLGRNGQTRLKNKLENIQKATADTARFANSALQNKQAKQVEIETAVNSAQLTGNIPIPGGSPQLFNNQAQIMKLTWEGLADLQLDNINIQREQSNMIAENLTTTKQIHQDLQYSNLNLANISQQTDEINRARRVDTSAEITRLLRVTSQTDLLVKKD